VLGGIEIPHDAGLSGHSDADAVAHAVIDALLGAACAGSIGDHYPDTDPRWKHADSMQLLREVTSLVRERGYAVAHADVTIVAQRPKLAPHAPAIAAALEAALGTGAGNVNVKAKTNEGMGFIGREEGLAVIAAATLEAR
jgi:2-C-methyl-D-erythritol 2,4-cyclodiphosphate synthase